MFLHKEYTLAKFSSALAQTLDYEGWYSNDPSDHGGETYRGISRKFWPDWTGWPLIDISKSSPGFPHCGFAQYELLAEMVSDFYEEHFWDAIMGEAILDQATAEYLFDIAVNHGVGTAVKLAQGCCVRFGSDIEVDGKMGDKTMSAINQWCVGRTSRAFLKLLKYARMGRYIQIVAADPSQMKFFVGWINRS